MYKPPTPEMLAYLDFSVSTTGILAGVKVSSMFSQWTHMNHVGSELDVVVMWGSSQSIRYNNGMAAVITKLN